MPQQELWIVAVLGAGTLVGIFIKMKPGFGPFNLRVVGIVLLALLASLLAIAHSDNLNAAMGILGAIAGYLFGAKNDDSGKATSQSGVDASESQFGDNAKIAGRDINETINNMQGQIKDLHKMMTSEGVKIDKIVASQESAEQGPSEYVFNTIYERGNERMAGAIKDVIRAREERGWTFMGLSSDYNGIDGIFVLFRRPSESGKTEVNVQFGSNISDV